MADNTTGTELGIIQIESKQLTNIDNFLKGDKNITRIECPFPNVESAVSAFENCSSLESFKGDLNSLSDGTKMFSNCVKLDTFTGSLPNLSIGKDMFYSTKLPQFNSSLDALTDGTDMFHGCESLTHFDSNLPNLESYNTMFHLCPLVSFKCLLIGIKGSGSAFTQDFNKGTLTHFKGEFPYITDAKSMFKDFTSLLTYDGAIPIATNTENMFLNCNSLTYVNAYNNAKVEDGKDFDGSYMFHKCYALDCSDPNKCNIGNLKQSLNMATAMFARTATSLFPLSWVFPELVFAKDMFARTNLEYVYIHSGTQFPSLSTSKCYEKYKNIYPNDIDKEKNKLTQYMFGYCGNLKKVDFDVAMIDNGDYMFGHCVNLTECGMANFRQNGSYSGMFNKARFNKISAELIFNAALGASAKIHIGIGYRLSDDFIQTYNLKVYSTNQWSTLDEKIIFVYNG